MHCPWVKIGDAKMKRIKKKESFDMLGDYEFSFKSPISITQQRDASYYAVRQLSFLNDRTNTVQ